MRIDPSLPMELDDGTPVSLSESDIGDDSVRVSYFGSPYRDESYGGRHYSYYYSLSSGIFGGGDKINFKVLQNINQNSNEINEVFL